MKPSILMKRRLEGAVVQLLPGYALRPRGGGRGTGTGRLVLYRGGRLQPIFRSNSPQELDTFITWRGGEMKSTRRAIRRRQQHALSLYEAGFSVPAISDHGKLRPRTVKRLLERAGIKTHELQER